MVDEIETSLTLRRAFRPQPAYDGAVELATLWRVVEFHFCEELSYFREDKIRRFFRGGREIAVVQSAGELYAFSNRCTHADFQLHFGFIEEGGIWCPIHYGVFDLATGNAKSGPVTDLETFEVRVEGQRVYVGVPQADEAPSETEAPA